MDNDESYEQFEQEAYNTGCSVLIWGALFAFLLLLVLVSFYFAV